jgi:hypothetical protein
VPIAPSASSGTLPQWGQSQQFDWGSTSTWGSNPSAPPAQPTAHNEGSATADNANSKDVTTDNEGSATVDNANSKDVTADEDYYYR